MTPFKGYLTFFEEKQVYAISDRDSRCGQTK